jgi:hypothetical protein
MKIIKNISLAILITLLVGCGSDTSIISDTKKIDGFWQDLDVDQMIEIKNSSIYSYQYNKEKVHNSGGECYSNYEIATIESNTTEAAILEYKYYNDYRFNYNGPIDIIREGDELKFLQKYEEGLYSKGEVVKHYEKIALSKSDIDMCNFANREGGIKDENRLEGLWKVPKDFKFEVSDQKVDYWLISENAHVRSLVYEEKKQCYITLSDIYGLSSYFFVSNVYNDGRLNLIYHIGGTPGTSSYRVVLASINDNILTFFGFDNNDIDSLEKADIGLIKLCN